MPTATCRGHHRGRLAREVEVLFGADADLQHRVQGVQAPLLSRGLDDRCDHALGGVLQGLALLLHNAARPLARP